MRNVHVNAVGGKGEAINWARTLNLVLFPRVNIDLESTPENKPAEIICLANHAWASPNLLTHISQGQPSSPSRLYTDNVTLTGEHRARSNCSDLRLVLGNISVLYCYRDMASLLSFSCFSLLARLLY